MEIFHDFKAVGNILRSVLQYTCLRLKHTLLLNLGVSNLIRLDDKCAQGHVQLMAESYQEELKRGRKTLAADLNEIQNHKV